MKTEKYVTLKDGTTSAWKSLSNRVVILGAGESFQGPTPSAIQTTGPGRRVMDWLLAAFEGLVEPEIIFVGGYKIEEIAHRYPHIKLQINTQWEHTGPSQSLSLVPLSPPITTWVSYSDIVFRPDLVQRCEAIQADIVLAVDKQWKQRYPERNPHELQRAEKVTVHGKYITRIGKGISSNTADGEFSGLVKLSPRATSALEQVLQSGEFDPKRDIPDLLQLLIEQNNFNAVAVDVRGDWAELNAPQDLARFVLGTKAESLDRLKPLLRTGVIDKSVIFTQLQWKKSSKQILSRISNEFKKEDIIVRSSALAEDCWYSSYAGVNKSIANISTRQDKAIFKAIEEVFRSYADPCCDNQVFVQRMLDAVRMSGVVMTRTPTVGAPYYIINFDNVTNQTDTVTSGNGAHIRTISLHRQSHLKEKHPVELHALMRVVKELEELIGYDSLDIEFAIDEKNIVHILQVRPIALPNVRHSIKDEMVSSSLTRASEWFRSSQRPSPFLCGDSTYLSVMTDWNPAEIIGTKPRPLAFSLYRYLITDDIWAIQRAEYGYRDVRPCNLLVDVLGHPYVDIRATFNSFVPATIPKVLATKLIAYYLDKLAANPQLHDKVEFEVLLTCITFDIDRRLSDLREKGFTAEDIVTLKDGLRQITRNAFKRGNKDHGEIKKLQVRQDEIIDSSLPALEKAYLLLEDSKRFGTLPFAHLARSAFLGTSLLRSLQAVGCTTVRQTYSFLASLRTVSSIVQADALKVRSGDMSRGDFVAKYGHLRPGTYDITSPSYSSDEELYIDSLLENEDHQAPENGCLPVWDAGVHQSIREKLHQEHLDVTVEEFEKFIRASIEGREWAKFVFTRGLSVALEYVAEFGSQHDICREDLSFVNINDLFQLRNASTGEVPRELKRRIQRGQELSQVVQAVCLPAQIYEPADFHCFEHLPAEPNFVTQKNVRAKTVVLTTYLADKKNLKGKIVVLPSADPGFDWIFSQGIVGLITMYGGSNSHMAVRAAEFELPAAIGVGELLYENIVKVELIELDCASRRIEIISNKFPVEDTIAKQTMSADLESIC